MSAFEITEYTEARLATVTNRVEKHGDDEKPAVSLGLEIEASNAILDLIDPRLRPTLYTRPEGQDDLPGVETVLPLLQCHSIDRVLLETKHEGWTLSVDTDIDQSRPMAFGSCKVDKFSVEPKQGGTVVLRLRVGTSDLDAARSGMLGMHVGQPIWITLYAPKITDTIDGTQAAFDADHPDAGDLFSREHGGPDDETDDDTDSEGGETDAGSEITGDSTGEALPPVDEDAYGPNSKPLWPFPDKANNSMEAPPQSVTGETTRPGTRTTRGREKTKAALAAGVAAK